MATANSPAFEPFASPVREPMLRNVPVILCLWALLACIWFWAGPGLNNMQNLTEKTDNDREIKAIDEVALVLDLLYKSAHDGALIPPCTVLIVNTPPWHQEILESVAKQFPIQNLGLSSQNSCNSSHLVFDYKVNIRTNVTGFNHRPERSKPWLDYFEKYLANTTTTTRTTCTDGASCHQRTVRRDIRSASLFQAAGREARVQRNLYTTNDSTGTQYDAVIEASCYCHKSGYEWLGKWFLDGNSSNTTIATTTTRQQPQPPPSRSCVFHEICRNHHTPQSVWVSPHYDSYFIPTALPLADESDDAGRSSGSPSLINICSIGSTQQRNWDYLAAFLRNTTAIKITPRIRILGQGKFPAALGPFVNTTSIVHSQPSDHVEFHRQIREECDIIVLLINPQTQPDYFLTKGSKCKLTGSIPPIIAYRKPFVMHHQLLDLYKKELLPLNLPSATIDDTLESFGPALTFVVQEIQLTREAAGSCADVDTQQDQSLPTFKALKKDVNHLGQCIKKRNQRIGELQSYLKSLDLYVVTSGGTGSEALIAFMDQHTNYTVRSVTETNHGNTVHLGSPLFTPTVRERQQTTLVLMGDFWRSISSMHRRRNQRTDLLSRNIAKNIYGAQECRKPYQHYLETYRRDPVGIKTMLWTYIHESRACNKTRTVFLQAPYSKESIDLALRMIGMDDLANKMQGFVIRPRSSNHSFVQDRHDDEWQKVVAMYEPYQELESMFDTRLPSAWLASETPCVLYNYLMRELQDM